MKTVRSFALLFAFLFCVHVQLHATIYYWIRSTPGSWNTNLSWSLSSGGSALLTVTPGAADIVVFDNGGSGTCSINGNYTVAACSLRVNFIGNVVNSGFTFTTSGSMLLAGGTFTHSVGTCNHQGTFTQTGGTYTGGNSTLLVVGSFSKTGGSFVSPILQVEMRGNVTITSTGSFTHNSSQWIFSGLNQAISVTVFLASLNIQPVTTTTLTVTGTLNVLGILRYVGSGAITVNGGVIEVASAMTVMNTATTGGGTGTIRISGTGTFTLLSTVPIGQSRLPHLTIAKTGGVFGFDGTTTVTGNFLYDPPGTTGCYTNHAVAAVLAMSGNATLTAVDLGCTAGYPLFSLCDLTVMTGSYIQLGSYAEIRNLLFQPLSQLDVTASNQILSVFGNWTNQNTSPFSFNERNGEVYMAMGTITSSVTGGESFYDMRLVNPSGAANIILNSRVNIIHQLRDDFVWSCNLIYTSSSAPLVFLDNATLWYSSPTWMTLLVVGPVIKIGNDAFSFPVGAFNGIQSYSKPISMSAPPQVTDEFTAQYFSANSNGLYPHASRDITILTMSDCDYWTLNRTAGFSQVSVTLSYWDFSTPQCIVLNPADVIVCSWDGASWRNQGQSANTWSPPASGCFTSAVPIASYGVFTMGSTTISNPLPIELISFAAEAEMNHVNIQWETATETNNDYFTIERSVDGTHIESIDTVDGAGTSTSTIAYETTDVHPFDGLSYYRLKQIDFDGHFTYSEWKTVFMETPATIKVFPNPSDGNINLTIAGDADVIWTTTITDLTGQIVYETVAARDESQRVKLNVPPGSYVLRLQSPGINISQKLVITD